MLNKEPIYTNQEKFHITLNQSYNPNACYDNWTDYRDQLSNYYSAFLSESINNSKIAVIGAGHLNDVSLDTLMSAEQIHLVDIDREAMVEGVIRQTGSTQLVLEQNSIIYHQTDLLGLDERGFLDELSILMGERDLSGIERYLDHLKINPMLNLKPESLDVLIITPIYTQLLLNQYLELIAVYELFTAFERLVSSFLDFMVRLIKALNDYLFQILKKGGKLIVWSDLLEYKIEQAEYKQLLTDSSEEGLQRHVLKYETEYGKGIGAFGIENLEERLEKVENHYLIWPLNEERHLIVKLSYGIK